MASSNSLTLSILSILVIFPIFFTLQTIPILCSPTFKTKDCNIMALIHLRVWNLNIFIQRFISERVGKLSLDLGILRNFLSISPSQSGKFVQSRDSISELSIKLLRVSLYLLGIAQISDFASIPPTTCLSICF